jgi:hypothetical protein
VQCLYCGAETCTGGSHPDSATCLAALLAERERLLALIASRRPNGSAAAQAGESAAPRRRDERESAS